MNVFNRVVVTLLLLALIPIVTVALIVPSEAIGLLRDGLDQIEGQVEPSVSTGRLLISGALALLIDSLLVFLLYLELRRPRARAVPVQQVKGGQAQVSVDSIVGRLEYHIDRLSGVLEVKPRIVARRRGVEVVLDVETTANLNVPATIEEINAVTRRVVEGEMGLKIRGEPKVNLRTVAYPTGGQLEPATLGGIEAREPVDLGAGLEVEGVGLSVAGDDPGVGAGHE